MANTLQHCLPLIRFFSLPSKEFFNKVRPYEKLLDRQLYVDLLKYYLDPDSKPSENILPPIHSAIGALATKNAVNPRKSLVDLSFGMECIMIIGIEKIQNLLIFKNATNLTLGNFF